jgi:hypothetical protein
MFYQNVTWKGKAMTEIEGYLAIGLLLAVVILIATLLVLFNLLRRYERFRNEAAALFNDALGQFEDINRRLIAAGYPPGRVLPTSTYVAPPARTIETMER